jgi:hypothetical protein
MYHYDHIFARYYDLISRGVADDTAFFTEEALNAGSPVLELEDGRVVSKVNIPFTLRWAYRYEMQHLFELCGFKVEALYGDFNRGEFKYGGEQIWVTSKA